MCPVDALYCPADSREVNIYIDDTKRIYERAHLWSFPVPLPTAVDWNCKYIVRATKDIVKYEKGSYIMVWVQLFGFHEEADIILQQKDKYKDVLKSSLHGAPNLIRLNESKKLYIPIEYDIYISFAPTKHNDGIQKPGANIRLKAKMFTARALMFKYEKKQSDEIYIFRSKDEEASVNESIHNKSFFGLGGQVFFLCVVLCFGCGIVEIILQKYYPEKAIFGPRLTL